MKMQRAITLIMAVLFLPVGLHSASGQSEDDWKTHLQAAINRFHDAETSKTKFTYRRLDHTLNFNKKGKLYYEKTQLYEIIYIGGLEYGQLLEVNGKPLAGQDLLDEQKRYDDAVHERAALDYAARMKLQKKSLAVVNIKLSTLLTQFKNQLVGRDLLNGKDCLLIDSAQLSDDDNLIRYHLRLWVDPKVDQLLRADFEQLQEPQKELPKGASGTLSWDYLDGLPAFSSQHFDLWQRNEETKWTYHVIDDHTFSNYRRFAVEVEIAPGEEDKTK